jgi:hypothetical protein
VCGAEHGFKWRRHYFERMFHDLCLIALAKLVVGTDWSSIGADVAAARGWKHMAQQVIGKAPRRFGKSVSAAKLIVAVAEVVLLMPDGLVDNDFTIVVFSTGKRASNALSDYCARFIAERGLNDYIVKKNQEKIVLCAGDPDDPDTMRVSMTFLPSNPKR